MDITTWNKLLALEKKYGTVGRRRIEEHLKISTAQSRCYSYLLNNRHIINEPNNIKATSTLTNADGEVILKWTKADASAPDFEQLVKFYTDHIPPSKLKVPKLKATNKNLMLEWPLFDVHHGMRAWEKETGNEYNCQIAKHLQVSAGKILLATFGYVKRITIILGGDNQTSDNRSGKTERSGNIVDTAGRFGEIIWSCFEAAVSSIETACLFADEVYVIVLSGNHDYHSALFHSMALNAHYRNIDKVTVDTSVAKHRFYSWGHRVVMTTHGDINEKRVGPFALQRAIRAGYAKDDQMRLHVLMGHLHTASRKTPDLLHQEDGITIERFNTIAASEAYSVDGAYTSCRATDATLWHKEHAGRYGNREVTVGDILDRFPLE